MRESLQEIAVFTTGSLAVLAVMAGAGAWGGSLGLGLALTAMIAGTAYLVYWAKQDEETPKQAIWSFAKYFLSILGIAVVVAPFGDWGMPVLWMLFLGMLAWTAYKAQTTPAEVATDAPLPKV